MGWRTKVKPNLIQASHASHFNAMPRARRRISPWEGLKRRFRISWVDLQTPIVTLPVRVKRYLYPGIVTTMLFIVAGMLFWLVHVSRWAGQWWGIYLEGTGAVTLFSGVMVFDVFGWIDRKASVSWVRISDRKLRTLERIDRRSRPIKKEEPTLTPRPYEAPGDQLPKPIPVNVNTGKKPENTAA